MSKADPARSNPLGPIVEPGLLVLFVGINPSLRSAEVGHHFARPGNRFWPALYAAGYTPRLLRPEEDGELPAHGVGVTNIAFRPTRAASELSRTELRAGAAELAATVQRTAPRLVAMLGLGAYREAFERPAATWGFSRSGSAAGPCGCCRTRAGSTRTSSPPTSRACIERRAISR